MNCARWDLSGGRSVMNVPTAIHKWGNLGGHQGEGRTAAKAALKAWAVRHCLGLKQQRDVPSVYKRLRLQLTHRLIHSLPYIFCTFRQESSGNLGNLETFCAQVKLCSDNLRLVLDLDDLDVVLHSRVCHSIYWHHNYYISNNCGDDDDLVHHQHDCICSENQSDSGNECTLASSSKCQ